MTKRLMVMAVGAGMGSLVGVFVAWLGAGNAGLFACAVLGAVLPLLVLGRPGK